MKFQKDDGSVSFSIPDKITIRNQLKFKTHVFSNNERLEDDELFILYWEAGLPMIEEWECELIPKPAILDFDKEDDNRIADIVFWVGNKIAAEVLVTIPKEQSNGQSTTPTE